MPFPFWYTGIWPPNLFLQLKANFYNICPVTSQTYCSEKQGNSECSVIPGEATAGPAHETWFSVTHPIAGIVSNATYTVLLWATETSPSDSLQAASYIIHKNRKDIANILLAKSS